MRRSTSPPRTPTINDVAKRAGVSIATVSRVLNGSPLAGANSIRAVHAAVAELGFRPNAIGRYLKTARTRTLGLLVPSLSNPVFAGAVHGAEMAANQAGYSILLTTSEYEPSREVKAIEALLSNRVEGLVLTVADAHESASLDLLDAESVPYVLLFNEASGRRPFVSVDNAQAARELVGRLIAFGHRRIAMIAGAFQASDRSRLRHAGYVAAMEAAGLAPEPVIEVSFTSIALDALLKGLYRRRNSPTAFFCSTDLMAIALCRGLAELGFRVPEDVSVVGFDGIDVGQWMRPSLATVAMPLERMGGEAVARLLDMADADTAEPASLTLPHSIRDGESWGPVASTQARYRPKSEAKVPSRRNLKRKMGGVLEVGGQ